MVQADATKVGGAVTSPAGVLQQCINNTIEADNGSAWRGRVVELLQQHEVGRTTLTRSGPRWPMRIGVSTVGRPCRREIWYGWRWYIRPDDKQVPARMQRLFNRGHFEEYFVVAMLELIGCKVFYKHDNLACGFEEQPFNGHIFGFADALIMNVPGFDKDTPVVVEIKTHNDKNFTKLTKNTVAIAKREHYIQTMLYMYAQGVSDGLYFAVNKNNDEIYLEHIKYNQQVIDDLKIKFELITLQDTELDSLFLIIAHWRFRKVRKH